jgi:selenocysteine lyase/cysteine desulfurase
MLRSRRDHFDIPEDVLYLNCAAVGPLSRETRAESERQSVRKAQPWKISAMEWLQDVPEQARAEFGRMIGADAEGVALIPSTSYGVSIAARNLRVPKGSRILLMGEEFPSNVYPWQECARLREARVEFVPRPPDLDWTRAFLEAIGPDVSVVSVGNCHWMDGTSLDLTAVRAATRRAGAALVVDAAQSLGAHPLDVATLQPDFLVCASYKWLLGPYSVAFLYVAPEHRGGLPLEMGWISREGALAHHSFDSYSDEFSPGARRFDMGERSNLALLPVAISAMRQLREWDVARTRDYLAGITGEIEQGARERGLLPVPARSRLPHMLGIRFRSGVPDQAIARLEAKGVFVSLRGDCLRVAPHVFSESREVGRFLDAVSSLS